ncbi:HAD family hydrolase [Noviherbaspirillum autotrophicum]|nr:hypothetical protein [Noviherbaspirillum autotrophicum]
MSHLLLTWAWTTLYAKISLFQKPTGIGSYWPLDRWDVRRLDAEELPQLRACFDHQYWSTIPAISGAVDACHALAAAGYDLVCVTAIKPQYQAARLKNLCDCGFPITRVLSTPNTGTAVSPKAAALMELRPVAFVDDFLLYLRGIPAEIHAALVLREPNGSPNTGEDLVPAHSQHPHLAAFAEWWLSR